MILICVEPLANAQVKVHAHNDYEKPHPFLAALQARVYSMEADVMDIEGTLRVAHEVAEGKGAPTFEELYLLPIVNQFQLHQGRLTQDTGYILTLLIDCKTEGPGVLDKLLKLLSPYRSCFDRTLNPYAVQIVVSGNRGPKSTWEKYPNYLLFDGRPYETYSSEELAKIAWISDDYSHYFQDQRPKPGLVQAFVSKGHQLHKLVRFWGYPDREIFWQQCADAGVDLINTDDPFSCQAYFKAR